MNRRVSGYLDTLGLTESLRFRVESLIARCELVLGSEPSAVIVSEYVSDDVGRVFESVFAFTDSFLLEAQVAEEPSDQVDIVPLKGRVRHWILTASRYDLRTASNESRLSTEVWLDANRLATIRASGQNCDHLVRVGLEFIRPNLG